MSVQRALYRPVSAKRIQAMLPMDLGYVEGVTHDYVRYGSTTWFAVLDIANGNVLSDPMQAPSSASGVPRLPAAHRQGSAGRARCPLIVDNYVTHKHPKMKAWLAQQPRIRVHYPRTCEPGQETGEGYPAFLIGIIEGK